MPVFSRFNDQVLVVVVDGDYTTNELRRVAFRAFEAADMPRRVPVLLDLSGAAGVGGKSAQQLQATGAIFGAYRDRITGIGVVASPAVQGLFTDNGDFAREALVSLKACHSHIDAHQWLRANSR